LRWYSVGAGTANERGHLGLNLVPDILLQAHSSTLQLVFYDADAFPAFPL
jgi:hypothetical protein